MEPEVVKEEVTPSSAEVTEVTTEVAQPGSKTDPALLLKSLKEEREKRQAIESRLKALEETQFSGTPDEDLGRKVAALEAEITTSKVKEARKSVESQYPQLKDKSAEFEEYLEQNKGLDLTIAAKGFLIENGLLETPKARKGLETGGTGRVPTKTGMTEQEVANLRVNNYREYQKRLRAGTLWD